VKLSRRSLIGVALVLAAAAVCVRLGFWQLDRLEQRRARNAALREAMALPPLRLDAAVLPEVMAAPERFLNRRVVVRGVYDPAGEVVLRGRSREGRPGVHLATPLRIAGAEGAVLVNRGWVPSPDAATVDPRPFAEPGAREVRGILQEVPRTEDRGAPAPGARGGVPTHRRLDLAEVRARAPYPVLPLYVQQLPDPSLREPPHRVGAPELSEGSHLSYAVQWFSFAAIAVIGLAVFLLRGRRGEVTGGIATGADGAG
jgi:surfeit locus 1 family protein